MKALLICYGRMGKMEKAFDILEHLDWAGKSLDLDLFITTM